jgi:hypothetical protein
MSPRLMVLACMIAFSAGSSWGISINLLDPSNRLLWNTGWTSGGVYGTNDAQDGHYTWTQWTDALRSSVLATGTAYIINDNQFPFPYWRSNESGTAAWVSTAAGPPEINAEAWYSYYTSFTLPSTAPAWDVNLNVSVWADNQPQWIGLYFGSTLVTWAQPPPSPTSTAHSSSYSGGPNILTASSLLPGTYTIRFDVYNAKGSSGNPTGLFVRFNTATALGVPEPSTYALMGTVGLALYLLRRRKKAAER